MLGQSQLALVRCITVSSTKTCHNSLPFCRTTVSVAVILNHEDPDNSLESQ